MKPYFSDDFENASALYSGAQKTKQAIENSRAATAKFLNCSSDEVVFTSGGTESDNLAIFGSLKTFKKGHIITTIIEHPAVLEPLKELEKRGFDVTYLKPGKSGIITVKQVKDALRSDTLLVSIMYANNEIGTIQPIKEISKVIRNFKNSQLAIRNSQLDIYPLFHTDACQATGYLNMNVVDLGVDLLTLNGSKIYAPKGVGVLFIKQGIKISPLMLGGEQEMGLRAGTENVSSIVGLSKALSIISKKDYIHEKKLQDYLISKLLKINNIRLNGSIKRLPNNINISVEGIEGESLVLYLDRKGIEIATGSACSSKSLEPSRIITAISNEEIAHSSLRITIGRFTTRAELDIFLKEFKDSVYKLREMSAL
jgi:cysteine desulfurase